MKERNYEDMLHLPHHQSTKHPHMSVADRAAQFSPFAALTGYDDEVKETARLTEVKPELTEDEKAVLDEKLREVCYLLEEQPRITVQYYVPDERKSGGHCVFAEGKLKKVDYYERVLVFCDGRKIALEDLLEIIF